jgi:hypothetical protein
MSKQNLIRRNPASKIREFSDRLLVLKAYGTEAELGRALLREHVKRIRARLWSNLNERRFISHAIYCADVPEDVHRMIAFFVSLRPANDEKRQYLASARDIFGAT